MLTHWWWTFQLEWEPVTNGDASVDQHVAGGCHLSVHGTPLPHPLRRCHVGESCWLVFECLSGLWCHLSIHGTPLPHPGHHCHVSEPNWLVFECLSFIMPVVSSVHPWRTTSSSWNYILMSCHWVRLACIWMSVSFIMPVVSSVCPWHSTSSSSTLMPCQWV